MKIGPLIPKPLRLRLIALKAAFGARYRLVLEFIDFSSPRRFQESVKMLAMFLGVRSYTLVTFRRLKTLVTLSRKLEIAGVEGDIVECGVFNGGSAAVLGRCAMESRFKRHIWLFDSFEGVPAPTPVDGPKAIGEYYEGLSKGSVGKVREILQRMSIPDTRVTIERGWFQDTFPKVEIPRIALLHIDADWYQSVNICLDKFYDAVEPGGFIIIDDYGYYEGCRKATDEFLAGRGLNVDLPQVEFQQVYFEKPGKSSEMATEALTGTRGSSPE
jgi:O-methyltransferase